MSNKAIISNNRSSRFPSISPHKYTRMNYTIITDYCFRIYHKGETMRYCKLSPYFCLNWEIN